MGRKRKPPLGVMPAELWAEAHPEPSLTDLVARYHEVADAVARYRAAGLEPPADWLRELGVGPDVTRHRRGR